MLNVMTDDLKERVEKCWSCGNYYIKPDENEQKGVSHCKLYGILYERLPNVLEENKILNVILSKCDKGNNYSEKAA